MPVKIKPRSKNGTTAAEKVLGVEASIEPDEKGCLVWPWNTTRDGHGHVWDPKGKLLYVHRVAWEVHKGPIPDGLNVLHKPEICHNPACFNVDHLYVGTDADNAADRVLDGTVPKSSLGVFGEDHPRSKLSNDERYEICRLFASGHTKAELGERFGVTPETIMNTVNDGRWGGENNGK